MTQAFSRTELLIAVIARLLEGCRHVIVGAASPIPGSAALLMRELTQGALKVTLLGSRRNNSYTDGGVETFLLDHARRRGHEGVLRALGVELPPAR